MSLDSHELDFATQSIDLAAFLFAVTGRFPSVYRESALASFSFKRTPELLTHIEEFCSGRAVVNAQGLLSARRALWNEARRLKGGAA